jgi:hypothetical protein
MTDPDKYVREVDDIADGPDPDVEPGPPETEHDIAEAQRLLAAEQSGDGWDAMHDDAGDDGAFLADEEP